MPNEHNILSTTYGGIPYTAHAQITPPPSLFLFIFCFYAYFRLGKGYAKGLVRVPVRAPRMG